jgi:RNA polymerase sigma-70 factor (ECF subfamily)
MAFVGNKVREAKKYQAVSPRQYSQNEIKELVIKASCGNFSAFGTLYEIYLDRIYRYVYYQINDRMAAEDITEDVFVKAWKSIQSCRGREATFSAWLYRIAHNHLVNILRRENKQTSIEKVELVEIDDAEEKYQASVDYRDLLVNIRALPPKQKQVLVLKFVEGMDNREISEITGKKEGAIRVLQMRALTTLRKKLGQVV